VPVLVASGTPAFQAGLDEGDLITHADGNPVASVQDWQAAVRAHKPGERMPIQFTRHGAEFRGVITLVEDPSVEVVSLESTGGTLSADQKAFRDGWLGTKTK
jgi:S1-C subfamily serine protease